MVTLRETLEKRAIPNDGVSEEALDVAVDKLDVDHLKVLVTCLNDLYVANPSIRDSTISFLHDLLSLVPRVNLSPIIVTSPFFPSFLLSLLLDTSPHLFSSSVALFSAVFPYAPAEITPHIPILLTVLARAACWRPRHTPLATRSTTEAAALEGRRASAAGPQGLRLEMLNHTVPSGQVHYLSRTQDADVLLEREEYDLSSPRSPGMFASLADAFKEKALPPRADLGWKVFKGSGPKEEWNPSMSQSSYPVLNSPTPAPDHSASLGIPLGLGSGTNDQDLLLMPSQQLALSLLMNIHGLWPSNLVAFIRNQKGYLQTNGVECVYEGKQSWEGVWEEGEVAVRMSSLLKAFAFNPQAIFADAPTELSPSQIAKYAKLDPATVVVSAHSLYRGYGNPGATDRGCSRPMGMTSAHGPGPSRAGATGGRGKSGRGDSPNDDNQTGGSGSTVSALSASSSPPNYKVARGVMSVGSGLGMSGVYTAAKPIAIGGSRGNDSSEREAEGLRIQVEDLTRELAHTSNLKDLYLAHVHRLHEDSITFASDEAERQLLFVSFKDQKARNAKLSVELAGLKLDSTRMQDTLKKSSDSLREKLSKMREDNRKAVAETSLARAQLEDANRSIDNLQVELTKVKETNFRLNNRLIEADPHIRHIDDYREEIRILKEGQLKWDADVRKLVTQDETISIMTGRWRQMEDMVMASNRRAQQAAEDAMELQETVAGRDEVIRRMKLAATTAQSEHPAFETPSAPRESDSLKGLLLQARDRIEQLNGEKLDLQAELEQHSFTSRNRERDGPSILL